MFLELVSCNNKFAKFVKEERIDKESGLIGIRITPLFNGKLPPGCFLTKEMREWFRDWMERAEKWRRELWVFSMSCF